MNSSAHSTTEVYGKAQSLMCSHHAKNGIVTVDSPNRQVKDYYKILGIEVPAHVEENSFREKNLVIKK